MRFSRRRTWIAVFLFCAVVWGLIAVAVVYAADLDKGIKPVKPIDVPKVVDVQKIKKLDLNEKQRKFIDSLIEQPDKKPK